jgi:hypothetical protein
MRGGLHRALLPVACVALAAGSLAIQAAPTFDPWAWIGFGRGMVDPAVGFSTLGRTGWKPLPVLFTAPLGLLGGAAPNLWLVVVRAVVLAGTVLAYRLAARVGGRAAGLIAAAGFVASADWLRYGSAGNIEPVVAALLLGAIEAHLRGRRAIAFVLLVLAGLARPELWPLVGGYGVLLAVAERRSWPLALGIPAMVALWVVPDWVGSGDPLRTFHAAGRSAEPRALQLSHDPVLGLLDGAARILAVPIWVGAVAALVLGWRTRDRTIGALAAVAGAAAVPTIGATAFGYPAVPRYLFPVAAVCCVLGGIGLRAVWRLPRTAAARTAVAVALAVASTPFAVARADGLVRQAADAGRRDDDLDALFRAVAQARRRAAVACLHPALRPSIYATALAWKLGVEPHAVTASLRPPGRIAFLAHRGRAAIARLPPDATVTPLAAAGPWRVVVIRWGDAPLASTCRGTTLARAARPGRAAIGP